VIVEYIDEHKDRLGVAPICAELQIAPSTYYAAKTRPPSARSVTDAATTAVIKDVHAANYGVYGVRKVHAELNRKGHQVARRTVHRLMRTAGLRGISRAKGPRTTIPGTGPDTRPDLVDRKFTATTPNQLWVADIERHEALLNLAAVKGHRSWLVAAGWGSRRTVIGVVMGLSTTLRPL